MTDPRFPQGETAPPVSPPPPLPSMELRRLDTLFRAWLREGRVHPLLHLMRRYRTEQSS